MVVGCRELASHKVGEENPWSNFMESGEEKEHKFFDSTHNRTTYLCDEHFNLIMDREEEYNTIPDNKFDGK